MANHLLRLEISANGNLRKFLSDCVISRSYLAHSVLFARLYILRVNRLCFYRLPTLRFH